VSIVEREKETPMAVETRFLIERAMHREHGSDAGSSTEYVDLVVYVVCTP
jgi:hypothetical protein